jgi:hypothetical protein
MMRKFKRFAAHKRGAFKQAIEIGGKGRKGAHGLCSTGQSLTNG